VGSVDGERLWYKELNLTLTLLEWNPDSKFIVFATKECKIKI